MTVICILDGKGEVERAVITIVVYKFLRPGKLNSWRGAMLRRTFSHLPGISEKREIELWESGVTDWQALYDDCGRHFSPKRQSPILASLELSMRRLDDGDLRHFYQEFPRKHLWRLLPGHESRTAFIDIETTGMAMPPRGSVTSMVVLMDGVLHVAYKDEHKQNLIDMIEAKAKLVVSYFGEVFDLPYLRKQYRTPLDKAHLDLCFALRRHGLRGGLKVVEQNAGIDFSRQSAGLDGFAAVILWKMYRQGNLKALETLLAYNAEDTIVLQPLAEKLVELEARQFNESAVVKFNPLPQVPHQADPEIVASLFGRAEAWL